MNRNIAIGNTESAEIYIKNNNRALPGRPVSRYEDFQSEHERVGVVPGKLQDFSKDFELMQKKKEVMKKKACSTSEKMSRAVASGHNVELSWIPKEEISDVPLPIEEFNQDPNEVEIKCGDIRLPNEKFVVERDNVNIDDIMCGDYFIVVNDIIVASSPKIEDIEQFVERLVYSQNEIKLEDIIVLRKMKIKVGVSVG